MNLKSEQPMKIQELLLLVCALIMITINSVNIASQKSGYFLDETCTFMFSNSDAWTIDDVKTFWGLNGSAIGTIDMSKIWPTDRWISHDQVIGDYIATGTGMGSYLNVFLYQAGDVHPPLYYLIIHTITYLFPAMPLKWVGFSVNFVFLIATCILIFRICKLLTGQTIISVSAILYYGLSYDFANNMTYYRMYAMLTFWFSLLIYMSLKWNLSDYAMDKKTVFKICAIEFLAMLTQYFAVFIILPVFVLNLVFMHRRKLKLLRFIISNIVTAVAYIVLWPFSIIHILFSNRGQDVTGNMSLRNLVFRLKAFRHWFQDSLFAGSLPYMAIFFLIAFIFILIAIAVKIRKKELLVFLRSQEAEAYSYLVIPSFFYYVVVANIAPFISDRYHMPVMPMLAALIILVLADILQMPVKNKTICGGILIAFSLLLMIYWRNSIEPRYLYNDELRRDHIESHMLYNAVLIDPDGYNNKSEIELNFPHPKFFCTKETGSVPKVIEAKNTSGDTGPLIIYINRDCNIEEIGNSFKEAGVFLEKLKYHTDYYYVYVMN